MLNITQPTACKMSKSAIARTISQYCKWFCQPHNVDRTQMLANFEDLAKEKHMILPTPAQIIAEQKEYNNRFVCDFVKPDEFSKPVEMKCYFDGERVVGYVPKKNDVERKVNPRTQWDDLFDELYPYLKSQPEFAENGKTFKQKLLLRSRIVALLVKQFVNIYCYDDKKEPEPCLLFIQRKIDNYFCAYNNRRKRFYRKVDQVKWTCWVTFTYDDDKCSEEEFKLKLLKKLQNYVTHRGWRYLGVFERGDLNDRLHFHGFLYIPKGKEVGHYVERVSHSYKRKSGNETYIACTEFEDKFGRNSFEFLDGVDNVKPIADYTSKIIRYMDTGCRVIYSRHIGTEFLIRLRSTDLITKYTFKKKHTITKYTVKPSVIIRDDLSLSRMYPIVDPSADYDPYEIGLL